MCSNLDQFANNSFSQLVLICCNNISYAALGFYRKNARTTNQRRTPRLRLERGSNIILDKTFSLGTVVTECTPTNKIEPQSLVGTCFIDVAASAGLKRISHCSWIQPHRRSSNSRFRQNFHTDDNSLRHVFFVLGSVRLLYRPRIKASRHFSSFVTSYRLTNTSCWLFDKLHGTEPVNSLKSQASWQSITLSASRNQDMLLDGWAKNSNVLLSMMRVSIRRLWTQSSL
jgi:hypothetical protein